MTLDVVTGGAGFIGSRLAEELLRRGRRVRVVDDFSTGRRESVPAGAELIEGDVVETAAAAARGAEVVYHLAANPSVPRSVERPLECHRTAARGTLEILAAAEKAGVRRVVVASSSSVYGDGAEAPRPLSPYAAAKLGAELYSRAWASLTRLETVALRLFNVYGPGTAGDAVVPVFVRALRGKRPLPVDGDGLQTRDFAFVEDVVRGFLAAGAAPGVSGRVYDLATGRAVTVLELGRALARLAGAEPAFEHRPARAGDVRSSRADAEAARRELGASMDTPLEEGLRRTWEGTAR